MPAQSSGAGKIHAGRHGKDELFAHHHMLGIPAMRDFLGKAIHAAVGRLSGISGPSPVLPEPAPILTGLAVPIDALRYRA